MNALKSISSTLASLDGEAAAALVAAAADVTLVMDADGMIQDIAISNPDLSAALADPQNWMGRHWRTTVSIESRTKIDVMLLGAAKQAPPRWRHVNHPAAEGPDVPILYSALRLGNDTRTIAIGRDLRAISDLQQRLVDAQQSMEQDYARLQHLELRYRLLFQTSQEAVLVLDSNSQRILEANPAAARMFGDATKRVLARPFIDAFDSFSAPRVQAMLSTVRANGRPEETRARLTEGDREVQIAASIFRQDATSLFLIRLIDPQPPAPAMVAAAMTPAASNLLALVERAPDAFIVADADGRIVSANTAFLEMAQLTREEMALGEPLDRWLGRPGIDVDVLVANLKQRGSIRLFATAVRGEYGTSSDVEVSAVAVTHGTSPVFGFTIRNVARRINPDAGAGRALPRSVEQLTELIGRVPLKDLVRETTDVIERLCIEAALELTGDNRASAAEMLGLSRQSLYVKLRRYGITDGETDADV